MAENKDVPRGIEPQKQKVYIDSYKKESRLRLRWFRKNEERLVAFTEKPNSRIVPNEVMEQVTSDRRERYQGVERMKATWSEETPFPQIDPAAVLNIMKPVDPATKKLLYLGSQKDGRKNYLKVRVNIIPENKYYFPETSSFVYGWNMWYSASTATPTRLGRSQVIKDSFYRRNGVATDPDWYQEPAMLSPTVCNCG